MDIAAATQTYLLYVVMPLWLAAGMADWLCHRASHIETTSGWKESAIHLLMLVEVGTPILLALLFEINALILALSIVAFVAHEATAHWDLRYALPRRRVGPAEQHVHNYLGALPFMALSFIFVMHYPQLFALLGIGTEPARFGLELKHEPLPAAYVGGLLAAVVLFELAPYVEEWWRGWTQKPRGPVVRRPATASGDTP
ncbi:MAG TPA: diguanylate cyclase [Vineibacter sp.]|nr:diguanylate cyclase [Vineibacter sp.]